MTDCTDRRMYLLGAARKLGLVDTQMALVIYAASPWHGVGRNTARRDLRDLGRRAYLVPAEVDGARVYRIGTQDNPVHPFRGHLRDALLDQIRSEGGEWTAGRAQAACRRLVGTHFYRYAARRLLTDLHRLGRLDCHGEGTPRRFFTVTTTGEDGRA